MRMVLLAGLVIGVPFNGTAAALEVRFPSSGSPAVTFDVPDGWIQQPTSLGGFGLIPADKSGTITVTFGKDRRSPDETASMLPGLSGGAIRSFQRVGEIEVSGCPGVLYSGETSMGPLTIALQYRLIRTDADNAISITQSLRSGAPSEGAEAVVNVVKSMRISPACKAPTI